jgi:membrane protein implicated in regulation of membrane protease activity
MPVVIVIMAAAFPRLFQFAAAILSLAAALAVLANGLLQLAFCIVDFLFALSLVVVVTVKRLRGNGPAQKRENDQCCNQRSDFLEHANLPL